MLTEASASEPSSSLRSLSELLPLFHGMVLAFTSSFWILAILFIGMA